MHPDHKHAPSPPPPSAIAGAGRRRAQCWERGATGREEGWCMCLRRPCHEHLRDVQHACQRQVVGRDPAPPSHLRVLAISLPNNMFMAIQYSLGGEGGSGALSGAPRVGLGMGFGHSPCHGLSLSKRPRTEGVAQVSFPHAATHTQPTPNGATRLRRCQQGGNMRWEARPVSSIRRGPGTVQGVA
jgi:hypothetical protein